MFQAAAGAEIAICSSAPSDRRLPEGECSWQWAGAKDKMVAVIVAPMLRWAGGGLVVVGLIVIWVAPRVRQRVAARAR
jgi:hypothetical protein